MKLETIEEREEEDQVAMPSPNRKRKASSVGLEEREGLILKRCRVEACGVVHARPMIVGH